VSHAAKLFAYLQPGSLPDWRDAQAYPDPQITSFETWATEFMVRNPSFQRDARELVAHLKSLASIASPDAPQGSEDGSRVPISDYDLAMNVGVAKLWQKYGAKRFRHREVMRLNALSYAQLFGVAHDLINQLHAEVSSLRGEPARLLPFNPLEGPRDDPEREYWIMPKKYGEFAIRFDLEYPLAPQLAAAKQLLLEERKRLAAQNQIRPVTNRQRARLYQTYLRVLDAEASGATVEEIRQTLFPNHRNIYPERSGEQAVRDALEAATKLRDGDYRNLPLLQK